ncbi:hypothetical protein GCM10010530_31200 [Kribbella aluminosa]
MTAALVIAPMDPVPPSATAHRGRVPGSLVEPRESPAGAPWMVRLSTGSPDVLLRDTSGPRARLSGVLPLNWCAASRQLRAGA